MRSDCADAILAERILDAVARSGTTPGPEHARHVDACDPCAVACERASRMKRAWQALEVTRDERASARARFLARDESTRSIAMTPAAVALATLLLATVALAGVRMGIVRRATHVDATLGAVNDVPARTRAAQPAGPWREEPYPVAAPLEVPVAAEAARAPLLAPAASPPSSSASREANPRIVAVDPAREAQQDPPASPVPASARTPSAWGAVATAMRSGDYAGAEKALDDLAASEDPKTRDDARLARAQLWIAQGHLDRARPELEGLAASAATSLVRERARSALGSLTARSPGKP